jgi:3',5'-nucleoside bisphosphate phosphatase
VAGFRDSGALGAPRRPLPYRASAGDPVVPPHPSRVDLHTHSRRSDGVLEPVELVRAAAAAGVRTLALSDHDTLAGIRELLHEAGPLPLELIPGVEINSVADAARDLWEGELHILGLGVDPDGDEFESTLTRQREMRLARFRQIVARLGDIGLPIEGPVEQFLAVQGSAPGASFGRPQIARCLVEAGHATSVDDAMQRLLARGRPAYVAREGLGPVEAIVAIRAAGGVAVLAHFADAAVKLDLVRQLTAAGLNGLEVHYRHFDAATVMALDRVARELALVPTGGSDFHGDIETYAEAHAQLHVPDEDAAAVRIAAASRDGATTVAPGPGRGPSPR